MILSKDEANLQIPWEMLTVFIKSTKNMWKYWPNSINHKGIMLKLFNNFHESKLDILLVFFETLITITVISYEK